MIDDMIERNNLTPTILAAALGVTVQTLGNWRRHLPAGAAERLAALEAAKRASGEWAIPGEPQSAKLRDRRRQLAAAARKKLTPEARVRAGRNAAAARVANREKNAIK